MTRTFPGTVFSNREGVTLPENGCGITVGNFDGVHLGHREIVARLISLVQSRGLPAVALTFDPHPAELLHPGLARRFLTTTRRRAELLLSLGLDAVFVLNTTPELLNLSAEEFYSEVLCRRFRPAAIAEGEDFHFGHNRQGTLSDLQRWAGRDSIALTTVTPVQIAGTAVSSSRIRGLLEEGNVADANDLLVLPYRVEGQVVEGQRRGKALGFPTANLGNVHTLVPHDGVYAGVATTASGARYGAAIHVGKNLTFSATERTIEVHLLGFTGDLYGQLLQVEFFQRLRSTEKFDGVEALREQLHADVVHVESLSRLNVGKPQTQGVSLSSTRFSG